MWPRRKQKLPRVTGHRGKRCIFFPPLNQNVVTLYFISLVPSCQLFLAAGADQRKHCPQYQNREPWISCLKASSSHFASQKSRNHFKRMAERDTVVSCCNACRRSLKPSLGLSSSFCTAGSQPGVILSPLPMPRGHLATSGNIWGCHS